MGNPGSEEEPLSRAQPHDVEQQGDKEARITRAHAGDLGVHGVRLGAGTVLGGVPRQGHGDGLRRPGGCVEKRGDAMAQCLRLGSLAQRGDVFVERGDFESFQEDGALPRTAKAAQPLEGSESDDQLRLVLVILVGAVGRTQRYALGLLGASRRRKWRRSGVKSRSPACATPPPMTTRSSSTRETVAAMPAASACVARSNTARAMSSPPRAEAATDAAVGSLPDGGSHPAARARRRSHWPAVPHSLGSRRGSTHRRDPR